MIEPATRSIPSSRAVARAHAIVGPPSGSALRPPAAGPEQLQFSGRATSAAPGAGGGTHETVGGREVALAIASRVFIWIAAARMRCSVLQGRPGQIDWVGQPVGKHSARGCAPRAAAPS